MNEKIERTKEKQPWTFLVILRDGLTIKSRLPGCPQTCDPLASIPRMLGYYGCVPQWAANVSVLICQNFPIILKKKAEGTLVTSQKVAGSCKAYPQESIQTFCLVSRGSAAATSNLSCLLQDPATGSPTPSCSSLPEHGTYTWHSNPRLPCDLTCLWRDQGHPEWGEEGETWYVRPNLTTSEGKFSVLPPSHPELLLLDCFASC